MYTRPTNSVLVIYTGGTIASVPKDRRDLFSPLVPGSIEDVLSYLPGYDRMDQKLTIEGTQLRIGTHSFEVPIDSSNIQPRDWVEIADVVLADEEDYDGFVVLHGTDTLAYTASALSFMLENLRKPVVITGSQRPIGMERSDATQNLVSSIEIAAAASLGACIAPEVCVFFRDRLYRGCRTTKTSASGYSGFASPNHPPLAEAGERIAYNKVFIREPSLQRPHAKRDLSAIVASLDIFPGMDPNMLKAVLSSDGLRGLVLKTFGTGNAPSYPSFLEPIRDAVENGVAVVNVTQCVEGEVELGLYDVSAGLLRAGVVSGLDMTAEAALTKMLVILSEEHDSSAAIDRIQLNLRGEQRLSIFHLHFPQDSIDEEGAKVLQPTMPMVAGIERFDPNTVELALLGVLGLSISDVPRGIIEFRVFIDEPNADEDTPIQENPSFLGYITKRWKHGEGSVDAILPITKQAKEFVDNRHTNLLSIVNTGGTPFKWERLEIAFYADC